MNFDDYVAHDALGLAALVASGEVSATELLDTACTRADGDDVRDVVALGGLSLRGVGLAGGLGAEGDGEVDVEGGEGFARVARESLDSGGGFGADAFAGLGSLGGQGDGDADGVVADGAAFHGVERDEVALELGVVDRAQGGEDVFFGQGHRSAFSIGKVGSRWYADRAGGSVAEGGDCDRRGGEAGDLGEDAGGFVGGDHAVEAEGDGAELGGDEDLGPVGVEVAFAVFEADVVELERGGVHAFGFDDAHAVGGAVEEEVALGVAGLAVVGGEGGEVGGGHGPVGVDVADPHAVAAGHHRQPRSGALADVLEANTRYELSVQIGNIASGTATSNTFFPLNEICGGFFFGAFNIMLAIENMPGLQSLSLKTPVS